MGGRGMGPLLDSYCMPHIKAAGVHQADSVTSCRSCMTLQVGMWGRGLADQLSPPMAPMLCGALCRYHSYQGPTQPFLTLRRSSPSPAQVSVRCWPDGKLVIQGKPSTPGVQDIREDLQLPLLAGQRLLAHSAQALFTDTGRLYVKVVLAPPKTPGGEASPLPSGTPAQQVPAPRAPLGQAY